jgi:glutathione S-transferase
MNKPRLTYFDFAGSRGEECRIALHLAGIEFDNVRVKSADRPALKESMPFGAMPVLHMPSMQLAPRQICAALPRFG